MYLFLCSKYQHMSALKQVTCQDASPAYVRYLGRVYRIAYIYDSVLRLTSGM